MLYVLVVALDRIVVVLQPIAPAHIQRMKSTHGSLLLEDANFIVTMDENRRVIRRKSPT